MCDVKNGMYCVDDEYKILYYNAAMKEMYPELEKGQYCYKTLALRDKRCDSCPVNAKDNQNSFYNSARGEWVYAQAAEGEIPGAGKCYTIICSGKAEKENNIKEHMKPVSDVDNSLQESLEREKCYRQELRAALDNEKEVSRSKSAFLFNMSHDIRTHMNAITGFSKIGSANLNDPDKVSYCLGKIESSSNHLLKLINDILDIARIENGTLVIEEQECNFLEFLHGMEDMVRPEMENQGLNFIVDLSGIRDEHIYCDTLHVGQILLNLLTSAMKFDADGGFVWLTVRQAYNYDTDSVDIKISVKDDGIGTHGEFLERIFAMSDAGRIEYSGNEFDELGLGLTITKKIVEALNGSISVRNMSGMGTEFIVNLNMKKVTEGDKDEESYENISFSGKRALLVEDNSLNREVAVELLGDIGLEIEEAVNGREAVNMVSDRQEGYYDVVFMDIQMPVLNGYEATKMIRRLPRGDVKKLPILAMTANAFAEDVQYCIDCGMNDHIEKPIDIRRIVKILSKYI